jgi:2-oxoglutarate ferredoxin oxidoreductase subunit alpha
MSTPQPTLESTAGDTSSVDPTAERLQIDEHAVEILSDSGEGAQKAGQTLGTVSARMGNGVWTVEIIPAEIKPPARSRAGASGIRVRISNRDVHNMGDRADLVVAFNEQVLYGRIDAGAFGPSTTVLLDNRWAQDPDEKIRAQYATALADFAQIGLQVLELPIEEACRAELEETPVGRQFGKNMFVVGMLSHIYDRDTDKVKHEVALLFGKRGAQVVEQNQKLVDAGWRFARENVDLRFTIEPRERTTPQVVMNGNQAIGLGILAAGIEVVSMYPITPATSVSHYLAGALPRAGGLVHQAEDEIAAIGFAIGASYAGKTACTITSGPGLALKTEFMGLAVMAEIPLVIVLVQRGGPSTGLPTKVEQGDLLAALYGAPGDAPKIVLAPATIEECFHFVVLARRLAEDFRTPVLLLSDANLATGVQPFPKPTLEADWLAGAPDQTAWPEGKPPYDWDETTGLSRRPIPGQRGGEYVVTGLAHTQNGKVVYDAHSNQTGCERRSRKLAALASTLRPPEIYGAASADILLVGWGSTKGSIEEAVDRLRAAGRSVSSLHLRFLSPLEPGLAEIFTRFGQVLTVELNYSDPDDLAGGGRTGQLATLLRAHTLHQVECWSRVSGQPLPPGDLVREVERRLESAGRSQQTGAEALLTS